MKGDVEVSFVVPVWAGGCAWQQFVPQYNQDPSKFPQVLETITNALNQAVAMPIPYMDSGNLGETCVAK